MATGEHHINTYLTSEELDALIGSEALERGNYYYDTDKDWYLIAISPSKLIPVGGRLTITNGDTLPTGIEPDVLLVDTGVISTDISSATGTPLPFSTPTGYYIVKVITQTNGTLTDVLVYNENEPFFSSFTSSLDCISIMDTGYSSVNNYPATNIQATGVDASNTLQAVIEFHKSPFPA